MGKRTNSITRTFILYAGLPMVLVLFLVVGLLTSAKVTEFIDARATLTNQVNRLVWQMEEFPGDRMDEIEAIRREHLADLDRGFLQDMALALAILLVGIAVPVIVSKHIAGIVEHNLNLLGDRLSSGGREGSALMPQAFDFEEFRGVADTMRRALRERGETEQRWKRAETELVAANNDLINQAKELKMGRKVALSMMEDAELAQKELQVVNERLNVAIEEAQASAREADIANHAKSDFLATMSHEIRTPLNGVIGFIDMLSETDLDEEQLDYVDTVRSSGKTLMALINDVLDFSKIESGHLNLEVRTFNLVVALRVLVGFFFNDATQKGINLEIEIGADVPRLVEGDEVRIRQILTNLLANAVKFTKTGEIRLLVNCDACVDAQGICIIEFEVRDSGIGIPQGQLESLFRPFSQGDSSTTRKYGGTGLGLVICKRLAEAMGGKVWATSQVGEGSSFFTRIQVVAFTELEKATPGHIPLMAQQESEPAVRKLSKALGEGMPLKIAVAEDNRANQRVLMIMLRRMGWEAVFTENGEELIDHLKENLCDLIFMDLQMPSMDGLDATALIRAGAAGEAMKDVKIIALTANALISDEARCFEVGMDAFLSKPLKIDLLKKQIVSLFPVEESDLTIA